MPSVVLLRPNRPRESAAQRQQRTAGTGRSRPQSAQLQPAWPRHHGGQPENGEDTPKLWISYGHFEKMIFWTIFWRIKLGGYQNDRFWEEPKFVDHLPIRLLKVEKVCSLWSPRRPGADLSWEKPLVSSRSLRFNGCCFADPAVTPKQKTPKISEFRNLKPMMLFSHILNLRL